MAACPGPLAISYGNGLSVTLEAHQPLRLSTMAWDFPQRPDLIALAEREARLDFLRDHLKSLCGLWDVLPRLFLDAYFRDIAESIRRNRGPLDVLAAVHGGLFQPEDWCYAALCPLPQARLQASSGAHVDFVFWTGAEIHAVLIASSASQNPARCRLIESLRKNSVRVTEIPNAELRRTRPGDLLIRLGGVFNDFWKDVPLPSSPFRIGVLDEILPP